MILAFDHNTPMGAKRLQTEKNNEEKKKPCLRIFKKTGGLVGGGEKIRQCAPFLPPFIRYTILEKMWSAGDTRFFSEPETEPSAAGVFRVKRRAADLPRCCLFEMGGHQYGQTVLDL
jgi:hypothetical protein